MSVKLTGSIEEVIQKIEASADEAVRALLSEAVDYLIINSPLDTGAYLESHTISNTAGRPRSQRSSKRKRGSGGSANMDKARAQLEGDVLKLNVGGEVFNIRNNSPHANIVEHKNFISGRYSVLSESGMLPAALMGLNVKKFKRYICFCLTLS